VELALGRHTILRSREFSGKGESHQGLCKGLSHLYHQSSFFLSESQVLCDLLLILVIVGIAREIILPPAQVSVSVGYAGGSHLCIPILLQEVVAVTGDYYWYFILQAQGKGPPIKFMLLLQRLDKAGILRGPGRGSASGSFISYILDITRVNPITQKLLFERFLPEGRKDPPDFDLDVQKSRRQEAIQILGDIVGRQTAQISTYARWHDKLKIRDACWLKRVNQDNYEADRLPDDINLDIRAICDDLDGPYQT